MAGRGSTKLAKYRAKRDFAQTPEPSGESARRPSGNSFVIQQHAARRMHYDFRLELDGVMLSWSVPKGPSLTPGDKRLAVRTEDHPLDYADFEGIIPAGQYGAGTVVVWDRGTWTPEGDARAQVDKGRLTFELHGHKLHGKWHLVRTKLSDGKAENWLLFKARDEAADPTRDIVASEPASVLSGRTIDEIAKAPDRIWHSDRAATPTLLEQRAARIAAAAKPDLASLLKQLPVNFALTNLDKVLYPEQGLTKGQLIAYLAVVAEHILPHVGNRPLTLVRCPEGRGKPCFYQKHILPGSPDSIEPISILEDGEPAEYMAIHDLAGLVAIAQLGTLEIHTWGCHTDKIERPDLVVFDLDPDEGLDWARVPLAAFELRRRLDDLGFRSFVKTTGGKGLHVVMPIARRTSWDDVKAFAKAIADAMVADDPTRYVATAVKARRKGKIFVDYLRNARGSTFIAPYSPRARPGAPVAVPVEWEELAHGLDPTKLTITTVPSRLGNVRDPWRDLDRVDQAITAATWRALGGKP